MHTSFLREAGAMNRTAIGESQQGLFAALGRLIESIVEAHARQLPPPNRDLPPEWFHYPIV